MKKAFLVTYTITTRVIIDTGNYGHADPNFAAHVAAKEKLKKDVVELFDDRFIYHNAEVEEDTLAPFNETTDKT